MSKAFARHIVGAAALICVGGLSIAQAAPVIQIDLSDSLPEGGGAVILNGSHAEEGWQANWELANTTDTKISINVNFTSNRAFTDEFEFIVSIPTTDSFHAPTVAFGSSSVNLMDNILYGDGAEMAALPNDEVFQASLNNTVFATLMKAPFSLVAGPYMTASPGTGSFNTAAGPAVHPQDVLKIRHKFTLTAWDTVQFVSTVVITPEPAALGLFIMGAMLVTRRRNRV